MPGLEGRGLGQRLEVDAVRGEVNIVDHIDLCPDGSVGNVATVAAGDHGRVSPPRETQMIRAEIPGYAVP